MKRWIIVGIAAVLIGGGVFWFSQNKKANAAPPITDGFTCNVAITYHQTELDGTLSRTADGKLSVSFSKPATLSGMTVNWDGEEMTLQLGSLNVPVNAQNVPQGALIKRLLSVLTVQTEDGELTEQGYTVSGDIDGLAYTVVYDAESGLIRSVSAPNEDLQVVFSDVKQIENEKNG